MSGYRVTEETLEGLDIAIVGMAARLPAASDTSEYWQNLRDGRECLTQLSDAQLSAAGVDGRDLRDPSYVKVAALFDELEQFDPAYFGFSKREAAVLDPQHRHFLEVASEALERAGIVPSEFEGPIGVFAGSGMHAYMPYHLFTRPDLMRSMGLFLVRHTGNDKDFLSTRLSYCLNLRGPSVNVQTACSTSLVAVHLAVQSLLSGESDLALAGGVTLELPHGQGYRFEEGEILSPDGRCRPFDANAKGTVFGSGAGVVVLRRLRDAVEQGDHIHAVLKGTAINNDGSRKVGYLAPSVEGQTDCIAEALQVAGLEPRDISYVECHGTGTAVGDPIEVAALLDAYGREAEAPFCGLGSVKSNIGHLDTAAGVASLIKVVEMLEHEQLAKTLHFEAPNPDIPFEGSPFYVVADGEAWPRGTTPRRAGVSSLGVGGTNAHAIVQEAPVRDAAPAPRRAEQLLVLSARSPASLDAYALKLARHLRNEPDVALADVSQTLLARKPQSHARVLSARSVEEAIRELEASPSARGLDEVRAAEHADVVFLFPGGGAQYPNMARQVYETEPVFRETVDQCLDILQRTEGLELRSLMFPEPGEEEEAGLALQRPTRTLPALLTIELAYVRLLESWGVKPALMIGHSVGEYAAAFAAGVIDMQTALAIVCLRGRLFEKAPAGGMISVPMAPAELEPLLSDSLSIGVLNTPELCVVSGPPEPLAALEATLAARDVECHRLRIEVAAHSPLLDPVLDEFAEFMAGVKFGAPELPYVSNVTGQPIDADELDGDYFVRHLRGTVRFSDCLETAFAAHPNAVFLEVGPGKALSSLLRAHPGRGAAHLGMSVSPHASEDVDDATHLLRCAGRLFAQGASLDLAALTGRSERRIIPLPTTPWEHERCWIDPGTTFFRHADAAEDGLRRESDPARWFYETRFQPQPDAPAALPEDEQWLLLAEPSAWSESLAKQAAARGARLTLAVPREDGGSAPNDGAFGVCLSDPASWEALLDDLARDGRTPRRILHALALSPTVTAAGSSRDAGVLERVFFSLLHLTQALAEQDLSDGVELLVLTSHAYEVDGEGVRHPVAALAQGPVMVAPRELPELRAHLLDLDAPSDATASTRAALDALGREPSGAPICAERRGQRYVQVLGHAPAAEAAETEGLGEAPVMLFTGGLGEIARALSDHFVRTHDARIALLSRSALPDPSEWPARIAEGGRDAALLEWLQPRVSDGGLLHVRADVTDPEALSGALDDVVATFGKIDVVVHAAGSVDDAPLTQKSRESAHKVLAAKVGGSEALLDALEPHAPRHVLLVGSTSAVLGPPGQVDYVAANAFVDAFARAARSRLQSTRVRAVGFGIWREVGMAARSQRGGSTATRATFHGVHPLLGRPNAKSNGSVRFEGTLSPEDCWALHEHRVRGGQAVLPGTAMADLVRAVGDACLADVPGSLEIADLAFLTPLVVPDGTQSDIEILAEPAADASFSITLTSRGAGGQRVEHARAQVRRSSASAPPRLELASLEAQGGRRTQFAAGEQQLPQEAFLDFGPRWNVVREMRLEGEQGVASLHLDPRFESDLPSWGLHPGLFDIATGFAFELADADATGTRVRAPLSYQRIRVHRPLESELWVRVRLRRELSSGAVAVFDAALANASGEVCVEVEGYTTKAIDPRALQLPAHGPQSETLLDRWLPLGLDIAEGAAVVERVLGERKASSLYASPVSLYALLEDLAPKAPKASIAPPPGEAGAAAAGEDQPRDDVERQLAELWKSMLGLGEVGIRQDFFELGGHSLIAVRVFSRIKKIYGVELSLATLFQAPTIESCAALIRDALGIDLPDAPSATAGEAPAQAPRPRGFSHLVLIQQGSSAQPFFCVHGAGGNVLNFRELAMGLGSEQTFYGIQARGVDGGPAAETIEEMAEAYVAAIREVQPEGPYLLGGYSGGGVVALEMAQQLRAVGQQVAQLVFLDTFHPWLVARGRSLAEMWQMLRLEGSVYLKRATNERFERLVRDVSTDLQLRFIARHNLPAPVELREIILTRGFNEAAARYQVKPYPGPVTLFKAEVVSAAFNHASPQLDWEDLLPELSVVSVPGNHDNLVTQPNVNQLTRHLRELLQGSVVENAMPSAPL